MSKICKQCGTMLSEDAKFCGECGTPIYSESAPQTVQEPVHVEAEVVDVEVIAPPRQSFDGIGADARSVRERLVGTKTEYYLPRFETMETLNSMTGWNWAAFFFGNAWMLYRKMYAFGIILWIAGNVLSSLGLGLVNFALSIGVGVVGNFLYMKDINNRTEKAMNMQPEERELFIQKNSGTSWTPVLLLFVASFVIVLLF